MTLYYRVLFILIFFSLSIALYSLGAFNLFNGTNRSDLQWEEITTEHVKIIYSSGLYQSALTAAAIADSTYFTLCTTFEVKPRQQILIYISDQDDNPNGATVLNYYIFLWVNTNDFVKYFTGDEKWLRKVIAHEMVHWFIAYCFTDWTSLVFPSMNTPFPRNFHEGYAQFFSGEDWGFNRGDRYLRTFAFSSGIQKKNDRWSGGFLYAEGFALVKYLAEFYGEEKLIELLKYRKSRQLSLSIPPSTNNFYSFSKAFKAVYKKSFEDMYDEWERYIKAWYYGSAFTQKINQTDNFSLDLTLNAMHQFHAKLMVEDLVIKGDWVIANVKRSSNQKFQSLIYGKIDSDSLSMQKFQINNYHIIENAASFISFDLSSNHRYVVYSRYTHHQHGRIAPLVTFSDLEKKSIEQIGEGSFPVVRDDGTYFYQNMTSKENRVMVKKIDSEAEVFISFNHDNQIGELRLSNRGNYLAASIFDQDNQFLVSIFQADTSDLVDTLQFQTMPRELLWKDEEHLAILLENPNTFNLDLYIYNLLDKSFVVYETPPYNLYPRAFTSEEIRSLTILCLYDFNRDTKLFGQTKIIRQSDVEGTIIEVKKQENHYYSRWIERGPTHLISDTILPYKSLSTKQYQAWKNIRYRMGLFLPWIDFVAGSFIISEPLGKHVVQGIGYLPFNDKYKTNPLYSFTYTNTNYTPTITANVTKTKWFSGVKDHGLIANHSKLYGISAYSPIRKQFSSFQQFLVGGGVSYYNFELAKEDIEYRYLFDDQEMYLGNIEVKYQYHLPWQNSNIHPVRSIKTSLSFNFADQKIGMKSDYNQINIYNEIGYAPFLFSSDNEFWQNFSIINKTNYRLASKDRIKQFLPRVDDQDFVLTDVGPFFSRMILRGHNQMMWGKELFYIHTDLAYKLDDQFLGIPSHYLGLSLWYDYTNLKRREYYVQNENYQLKSLKYDYKAMGYELKGTILGTRHHFGQAWKPDGKRLRMYYMLGINF